MKHYALSILRIGLGITFVWIGILIALHPEAFAGYIQPWALKFLIVPVRQAMIATAVLDIVIGVFLLLNLLAWLAAALGAAHLVIVLATTGINAVTVRDIGLLGASLALTITLWPERYYFRRK